MEESYKLYKANRKFNKLDPDVQKEYFIRYKNGETSLKKNIS